jgi:hypothetical protein
MAPVARHDSRTDHPGDRSPGTPALPGSMPSTVGSPFVPLAEPIPTPLDIPAALTPDPEAPEIPVPPIPIPGPGVPGTIPIPGTFPPPGFKLCLINLTAGCYRITFKPNVGLSTYHGTMRVDTAGGATTISGDLYRFSNILPPLPIPNPPIGGPISPGPAIPTGPSIPPVVLPIKYNIPIYARNKYYSYLKVTNIQKSPVFTNGPCLLTLTAQEYVYTHPPAGSFNGTFPAAPGTRTVTIVLEPKPAPVAYSGSYFEGKLYHAGVEQGSFTMGYVSKFFRRATLEIDTLTGSVAPVAVPASGGAGTEDFKAVLATAGWDLTVVHDQVNIPVPAGVTATACWSNANLHALMAAVRKPTTNLDAEWRLHLIMVPAALGCGRGVMYDVINVPREGVASFSHDGYPTSQSTSFGTAANKLQKEVPRAFLRSACHEVGHGFNQIHQEQEGGADNSIMTTTPNVANVLGGPGSGLPGVFPDNIALRFNDHVRHHMIHFPDVTVRPGGMTFGSGHSSTVPEADRHYFAEEHLQLRLEPGSKQIELGEPFQLAWILTNTASVPIAVPSDINIEAHHTFISVTAPNGLSKPMPAFVIHCEQLSLRALAPGEALTGQTRVFWSSNGFAFETPGKHIIEARIAWTNGGVPLGVKASIDVWVNYPQSTGDNDAAATLLHPDVGMYVALGGGASHLTDAVARIETVLLSKADGDEAGPRALRGFEGILPAGSGDLGESRRDRGASRSDAGKKRRD